MSTYEVVFQGGQVFDGSDILDADVAASNGRIAAVGKELGPGRSVVDVRGCLVSPGLVDLHAHSFVGAKHAGVDPDMMAERSGVLTVAEPGSAPLSYFDAFLDEIETRRTRIVIFMSQYRDYGVLATLEERRVAIGRFRDRIRGLKVVVFPDDDGQGGLQTLRDARILGDEFDLPLMVHYTAPPSFAEEAVSLLGPGDIVIHLFWSWDSGLFDASGNISMLFEEAQRRGVVVDVGHGGGKFRFDVARRALEMGFYPDTISTDLHAGCVNGPVYDLPTTASKILNLGMPLHEVLRAVTSTPARVLGLENAGRIAVGLPAEIVLMRLETGSFDFVDSSRAVLTGDRRLSFVRILSENK
jgi:dihydroorotase